MNERRLERALLAVAPPDEIGAQRRSWRVARTAFAEREPAPWDVRHRRPLVAAAIAAALLAALVTPPGRAVLDGVRDAVGTEKVVGVPQARPAPFTLPADGRVLVSAATGAWIVPEDGARRRLGDYDQATWSPEGRFVAASKRNQLAALTPMGGVRWSLTQPEIAEPRWAPSGFRVAYLSGETMRVVAGDGTGDRRIDVAEPVAPAWKPGDDHVLAYSAKGGGLTVVNTDTEQVLWTGGETAQSAQQLAWSADGSRLVAARSLSGGFALVTFDDLGTRKQLLRFEGELQDLAFAPEGTQLALIRTVGDRSELVVVDADSLRRQETVFSGKGVFRDVAWSPDAQWLLVGWESADQWLFIRSAEASKIKAVSSLTVQFHPGSGSGLNLPFPRIEGWCCQ